jgi:hypothetical protein
MSLRGAERRGNLNRVNHTNRAKKTFHRRGRSGTQRGLAAFGRNQKCLLKRQDVTALQRRGDQAGDGNDSVIPAPAGIQFFLETTEGTEVGGQRTEDGGRRTARSGATILIL